MSRMTLCRSALVLLLTLPPACPAAQLVLFTFDNGPVFDPAPTVLAPAIDVAGLALASGEISDFAGNPGRALGARGFAPANAIQLDIAARPGFALSLEAIMFDLRVSASGPQHWQLTINDIPAGSGDTATSFNTFALDLTPFTALQQLDGTVRVSLQASGAASAQGTLRLDNLELHGSASPVALPPAIALAMPAWLALSVFRPSVRTATRAMHRATGSRDPGAPDAGRGSA